MSSVDSRIVTAKFDNAQFERGAAETMSTLDKLKSMFKFDGASKGLGEVQNAVGRFNLNPMHTTIEGINKAWLAMSTIAVTALATVTSAAINEAKKLASGFLGPIKDGFHEYETTLNSVQTVLANTGLRGQKGLDKVNKALNELNTFSDKTIFSFSEMARNVGTFTAAGVKLKPSVAAIKGIADVAALSGSSATQAATGMYQLSQAIATGTVRLQDWLSVEHAGFGGKIFQDALKRTARQHGVAIDAMIKKNGSFRASLQENWLSSDILTETLSQFTGDLTDAQLRSMGYSDKQITKIQRLAKTAVDAATKVKTMSQLMGTLKEAAGSGWATTWRILLGDFGEAKTMFTEVNNVLGGFIQRSAQARNKVLGDWKALGGRTLLIESIKNAFNALMDVLGPIKTAFRQIFPPKTGQDLFNLTKALHDFTEGLKVSKGTQDAIKRTFAGLFAILGIGTDIIKAIVVQFLRVIGVFQGPGSGGILNFTANIGDMLVALKSWLDEGDKIGSFFEHFNVAFLIMSPLVGLVVRLASALGALATGGFDAFVDSLATSFGLTKTTVDSVVSALQIAGTAISGFVSGLGLGGIFDGFSTGADKAKQGLDAVNTSFDNSVDKANQVKDAFAGVGAFFSGLGAALVGAGHGIATAFSTIKDAIAGAISGVGLNDTLAVINTGFLTALYITIRSFLKNVGGLVTAMKQTFGNASGVLKQVTSNLKSMQTEVRAHAILEIAAALALLAAALYVLSKIDVKALGSALAAVTILLGELAGAILILEKKTDEFGGAARVAVLAGAMLLMAGAVLAMSAAVAILGNMDTSTLIKGLSAVGLVLAAITASAAIMEKAGGAAQIVVAAAGILVLAIALTAFAGALKLYASIDPGTLLDGGLKAAAAIVAIGLTMRAMPPDMLASAAAFFIVANALVILAGALKIMGSMSPGEMAKSLIMLGGSMLIIAIGMAAMEEGLPGALAMLAMAAALAVLVPSLVILGNLDTGTIVKSLLALVGIFAAIAIGAALLTPVAPILLALAGAVALLGLGVALIGGGLLAFSIGLATLAASGAAGIAVLTAAVIAVAELFPLLMQQFGLGLVALAVVISHAGPQLVAAFSTVLGSLIKAVIINTPKLAHMLLVLIDNGLRVLVSAIPKMVVAGIKIIIGLMQGVTQQLPKFAHTAANLMIAWLKALSKELPRLADAAAKFIIALINGIADAIKNNEADLIAAGINLATSIVQGIVKGLAQGIPAVIKKAKELAKSALDAAKHFLGIKSPSKEFEKLGIFVDQGFAKGIVGGLDHVQEAMGKMKDMINASIDAAKAQVEDAKSQLEELNKKPAKNAEEIDKVNKALASAKDRYEKATAARKEYVKDLADERRHLSDLGKQYDDYTVKIDDARKALEDAIKVRDDFESSTAAKVGELPDIKVATEDTPGTTIAEYVAAAEQQTKDVQKFKDSLDLLKQMGLDDPSYQKLLDEGPGIQPFLDELIAAGPNAVGAINGVNQRLGAAAQSLGHAAALELKQAGVDAAQGLLDGLISKREDIATEMRNIARIMIRAIKKELKSHSPSKVMEEIGKWTDEGLADGLDKHARTVEASAENVAKGAIDKIKSTLNDISSGVMTDMNMQPVITPVIDITQAAKDASALNKMMANTLTADASARQAASISSAQAAKAAALAETPAAEPQVNVNLTQNNNSPKALSEKEIYRDTKNLFSLTKEALKKP